MSIRGLGWGGWVGWVLLGRVVSGEYLTSANITNNTDSSSSTSSSSGTNKWNEVLSGKRNGTSYSELLQEFRRTFINIDLDRYMREEDGRVYSITDKDQRDDFVFDYSMEIGDTLFYNPHTDYYGNVHKHPVCLRLIAIRDTIMPNGDGRVRKCYDTEEGCLNGDDVYEFYPVLHSFIEDIGYTATGLSSSEIGTTGVGYSLLYVKQSDTMLYQQEGGVLWKDNTNIEGIKANNHDTPYYDLQGRKVANPPQGIYIKDGKKTFVSKE